MELPSHVAARIHASLDGILRGGPHEGRCIYCARLAFTTVDDCFCCLGCWRKKRWNIERK